ncbi:MAG: NAD(P)-binding protein [Actinobacteria bacterium]|nr:NAD(P)-binding protein [Actinomycetota bacterium]
MAGKEVLIYGGGMSGMVAAINLAREGHRVVIRDMEDSYGGSKIYNPSTHVTPIDLEKTSQYIGIDVKPVFHKVIRCPAYFHDTMMLWPVYEVFGVERGDRPGSLDTLLYKECLDLGVEFEFSTPLKAEDVPDLAPGTIIACGLIPKAYKMLDVPFLQVHMWLSRGEIGFTDYAWLWFDESITEYGYLSAVNNYYFNLLFSFGKRVEKYALEKYKEFMVRNEGVEHDEWDYQVGAVPLLKPDNYRLFRNGLIMCGTMSGAIDPFMGFGISGALVTGKVAAMAVSDPEAAQVEFDRFLAGFRRSFYIKEMWKRFVRPKVNRLERHIRIAGVERVNWLMTLTEREKSLIPLPFATPGFGHANIYKK